MRLLLRSNTGEFKLMKDLVGHDSIPPYAILSHTWGPDKEEVTFKDITDGTGEEKLGYKKIQFCGEQARQDGLQYFWIDTCCINKENDAELSRSINSMFRWYRNATRCYVYLSDVSTTFFVSNRTKKSTKPWESDFRKSRWFTRGWTLQELIAPASVEFFSQEGKRLGDKSSLQQQIHEITNISYSALQGDRLSQFSIEERLRWIEHRQTKLEEDRVYSLLGIFDVYILPIYGEGMSSALARLLDEFHKMQKCVQDLRVTDPRYDKKRIEETKGGLLEDSYRWILENSDFRRWRDDQRSQLLWIKGDPGKGKTMLLCGIINELNKSTAKTDLISYFFCQATDLRINKATAVLQGLLYMLVNHQPSLISHIRKKCNPPDKSLFEGVNAWVTLSEILANILQDPSLNRTYLIIDALDECLMDLTNLLDFIVQQSSISSRVKWIVSSRNEAFIEQRLKLDDTGTRLSLELRENAAHVSHAVNAYINHCLSELPYIQHDNLLRESVREKMQQKASGTFLWVSLAVKELKEVMAWEVLQVLEEVPTELKDVYHRMVKQIEQLRRQYPELCRQVLSTVIAAYRPLTLKELHLLSGLPTEVQDVNEVTTTIVKKCGSFLTIQEGSVYIIHQSARDFLSNEANHNIFPRGIRDIHHSVVSKSIQAMSKTLQRDMYSLRALGYPAKQVEPLDPDPLAALRYSCIYWIDHLCDWSFSSVENTLADLLDGGAVHEFLKKKYLYWLEAHSLCKSMSKAVVSIAKLETLMNRRANAAELTELVRDARRFVMAHKVAIENSPLQTYASALMFSPTSSLIRGLFKDEEPRWITIKPPVDDTWSACLQTLEGHRGWVNSVAFSHDSTRLASASGDNTVKIWDASSGECLQTLEGHRDPVNSVAFSHDSTRLASGSKDNTVKIWDASSGKCLQTLEGYGSWVQSVAFSHDSTRLVSSSNSNTVNIWDASSGKQLCTLGGHCNSVQSVAFSHDSTRLASGSKDNTVKIWDASSGKCLQTLEGHRGLINSVAFSGDSARLASGSNDNTVKIWDASSGKCLQTLEGHRYSVYSVAFSYDLTRLASASGDNMVKIWDASSGKCLQMLEGHRSLVSSVAFSHDSARLASASKDDTVKIWDVSSGKCLQMPEGHSDSVNSVAFSYDSTRLASASDDNTVKIWDVSSGKCLQTLEGHCSSVNSVAFFHDSTRLGSGSKDNTVKIWDASSGKCLQTLEGHRGWVNSVAFSHDLTQLASASGDNTVKIWDASSGKCLRTLEGHRGWVNSVAFFHDSIWLASGSNDAKIKIWDVSSGKCLQTLEGHRNSVHSVAFSNDSTKLVSASGDKTVKIWDASSGKCLETLNTGRLFCHISLDPTSLYLHTEIGTIDMPISSGWSPRPTFSEPLFQGLALSLDEVWITYNSENLLWLPSEYRRSCSAMSGKMIGVGVGSGKVWICKWG